MVLLAACNEIEVNLLVCYGEFIIITHGLTFLDNFVYRFKTKNLEFREHVSPCTCSYSKLISTNLHQREITIFLKPHQLAPANLNEYTKCIFLFEIWKLR